VQLTPGALGASLMLVGLALACAPLAPAPGARAPSTAPDAAIWVYGANRWTPDEQEALLARFAAIAGRLYLSVEDGPRLLVDDPDGARHLGELLDRAAGRFGLAIEAMLLQDLLVSRPGGRWSAWRASSPRRARRAPASQVRGPALRYRAPFGGSLAVRRGRGADRDDPSLRRSSAAQGGH
jgi:hypothetical protein